MASGAAEARSGARAPRTVDETSAGGLVIDRATARAALIGRRDRRGRLVWSLPKGHLEAGETAQQAAVREVREETGLEGTVVAELGTIDFWFMAEDRRIHKTVHHYLMDFAGGELTADDAEVDEVAWVPIDEVAARLTYKDERSLMAKVPGLLGATG